MIAAGGWIDGVLGQFFRIKHGYAFKGEFFADIGQYILLTPGNFGAQGGLQERGSREKFYAGMFPPEFLLQPGEMLVVMTDLTQNAPILGSPAIIPAANRFLHNQRLGKIVSLDETRMDKKFLYHLFNSPSVRSQIRASATGSTVRHTAPDRIYAVSVRVPPISIQRRIASILSAYDDLIENNTRRIKILEEMAQRIYREWFVHFRFPGHENVRMVESELGPIPEGWSLGRLSTVASVNELSIRPAEAPEVITYIDIASVSTGRIDAKTEIPFESAPGRARRIVRHGDTIWSTVRPNRRSYALVLQPETNLVVSTGFAVLSPRAVPFSYLYIATTTRDFADYLTNHATGSAYPAVNAKDFEAATILVPNNDVLNSFHGVTSGMFELARCLHDKNANLRATRDLLLPKLISGEINVEALEPELVASTQ